MEWLKVNGCIVAAVGGHRGCEVSEGVQVRLQAQKLCDFALHHHMTQLVDQPTHGREILDLFFCSDQHLVSHISTDEFPLFTDHKVVSIMVNYVLGEQPSKEEMFMLDSGRIFRRLDFSKAPWFEIRQELGNINWAPMKRLARTSPTLAHSWFLYQILPILERWVPVKAKRGRGRSRVHRKRKLLWRKLGKVKSKLCHATSVQRLLRLLQYRQDIELELKTMYKDMTQETEDKVISEMHSDPNVFFNYGKARRKTKQK